METNKILNADILDIIFDNRNKAYGAYELRKTYNKRIIIALIAMIVASLLVILGSVIANNWKKKAGPVLVQDVQLEEVKTDPIKPEIPPPPPKMPEPPKIEMAKFTPPKVVKDMEVKKEDQPPPVNDLDDKKIGSFNQEGKKDEGVVAPPTDKTSDVATEPAKPAEDYDKLYTKVENPAEFPGGSSAWKRYLEKNLDPDAAINAGATPGLHTVKVQFVVDKEGNISDVQALNDPGFGMADQAVSVIKKGPKWKPALQNGRNVNYRAIQSIGFNIQSEGE